MVELNLTGSGLASSASVAVAVAAAAAAASSCAMRETDRLLTDSHPCSFLFSARPLEKDVYALPVRALVTGFFNPYQEAHPLLGRYGRYHLMGPPCHSLGAASRIFSLHPQVTAMLAGAKVGRD